MNASDTVAAAGVIAGIAAGLIALAALIVSYKAWQESRRSADAAMRSAKAAEDAAAAAARSAAAEEAALAIARADVEQRETTRHEQAGPTFLPATGVLREQTEGEWVADVALRVDGGPERMSLRVELVPDTSFETIYNGGDGERRMRCIST